MRGPRSDSWARTGGWSLTGRGALSSVGPLTTYRGFGILAVPRARVGYWGVAKWQGTGFWSRDRRFESCRPSRGPVAVSEASGWESVGASVPGRHSVADLRRGSGGRQGDPDEVEPGEGAAHLMRRADGQLRDRGHPAPRAREAPGRRGPPGRVGRGGPPRGRRGRAPEGAARHRRRGPRGAGGARGGGGGCAPRGKRRRAAHLG